MEELSQERDRLVMRVLYALKDDSPNGVEHCNEYCLFLLGKLEQTAVVIHLKGMCMEHMHTGTSIGATLEQWALQGRSYDQAMAYLALWPTSGGNHASI